MLDGSALVYRTVIVIDAFPFDLDGPCGPSMRFRRAGRAVMSSNRSSTSSTRATDGDLGRGHR